MAILCQSGKLNRVTKSPLASETLALSEAADAAFLLANFSSYWAFHRQCFPHRNFTYIKFHWMEAILLYIPWPFPPGWGGSQRHKETTKTTGVLLRSSSNDEGSGQVWMALLEQHSLSPPIFHVRQKQGNKLRIAWRRGTLPVVDFWSTTAFFYVINFVGVYSVHRRIFFFFLFFFDVPVIWMSSAKGTRLWYFNKKPEVKRRDLQCLMMYCFAETNGVYG